MAIRLRPHTLVVATHELLVPAVLLKAILGLRLCYDVQENYFLNINCTNAFPPFLRSFIARYVRWKESVLASSIDHFFLAEECYVDELPFLGTRYTVLENKAKAYDAPTRDRSGYHQLVFTGTLATSTGVFHAIELAEKLHRLDNRITLTIVGYAALDSERARLDAITREKRFIHLIGGNQLIPHAEIRPYLGNANFGIVAYPPNPSTQNARPTKIFEYLWCELPMLLVNNPRWVAFCERYPAAVVFDPDHIDAARILREMRERSFYIEKPANVTWEEDAPQLLAVLRSLR